MVLGRVASTIPIVCAPAAHNDSRLATRCRSSIDESCGRSRTGASWRCGRGVIFTIAAVENSMRRVATCGPSAGHCQC
eukprot:1236414-Pleurochrysis_carterae.AAC.1